MTLLQFQDHMENFLLMNQAVEKMAEDFGVPPENVRFDDFGG